MLQTTRELLAAYQQVLAQISRPATGAEPPPPREITLSAGPFASLEAVAIFERALSSIPGVREVSVRGYEGANRAIVDVQLYEPRP